MATGHHLKSFNISGSETRREDKETKQTNMALKPRASRVTSIPRSVRVKLTSKLGAPEAKVVMSFRSIMAKK